MEYVKDVLWRSGIRVKDLVEALGSVGFQATELHKAAEIVVKMRSEGAKVILTFTSNMGTSGLRGLFAQLVRLGLVDVLITTVGAIEEDVMKALGERFYIHRFLADDIELHELGMNRVGNVLISNDSYARFEAFITRLIEDIYPSKRNLTASEFLREVGLRLNDENSFLYQAARRNVPVFCPAITDGALGFHLFMARERHPDFNVDVVGDFGRMVLTLSQEDRKGVIALGGGVSKHHAILMTLLSGGADYAIYVTTSTQFSGSMSGATTSEAKSWGKIRDDSDSVTVIGDATILFPLIAFYALEELAERGLLEVG